MISTARGWIGYFADRLYAWQNSLPPERCNYSVENVRVPLDGDLKGNANLYLTHASPPLGTLLIRTPYGIGFPDTLGTARFFAARGYHVLHAACRGTSGSEGEINPGVYEVADGHAVVEWMRDQPWYTSSFATLGGSYLGYTQWALLTDPPKDMKAAAIFTGPHAWYDFTWGTGAMFPHLVTWLDVMNRMTRNDNIVSMLLFVRTITTRYKETFDSVPLLAAVEKYFAGNVPEWLCASISSADRAAPCWESADLCSNVLEQTNIPVLLVAGWYDVMVGSVIEQYAVLSRRGIPVRLVVGPWTHLGAQGRNIPELTLPLIDEHLAGRTLPDRSPVRIFVTGAKEWRDFPHWPPRTSTHELFLGNKMDLSRSSPVSGDKSRSIFTFDPTNATPAIGAVSAFAPGVGTSDHNDSLVSRSDVLSWTSSVIEADLEVWGKPSVELYHSTDIPYADVWVVLSQVDAETGVSRQLSEKYLRLAPNSNRHTREADQPLCLALDDIAHVFRTGTRIRLSVAGGCHPRYIRNLGSGEDQATGTTLRSVQHSIQHHARARSKLCLPVIVEASP